MDYLPNIKPRRKQNASLTYLDDSDIFPDDETSEFRGNPGRSVRSTTTHRRPFSAESSNCSSSGFKRSEVRLACLVSLEHIRILKC